MERFKGTPGKWHYQKDADVYTHIVRPDGNPGQIILYGRQYSSEENKANLVLAAAAPDLLEALQDLWMRSTNLFGDLTIDEIRADDCLQGLSLSIDKAKEAISKALGGKDNG